MGDSSTFVTFFYSATNTHLILDDGLPPAPNKSACRVACTSRINVQALGTRLELLHPANGRKIARDLVVVEGETDLSCRKEAWGRGYGGSVQGTRAG